MKRFKVLFGQRRFQLLATMAVLLLAASVVVASGASFTSESANAANVFSSGTLAMTNTNTGMSATIIDMVPNDFRDASVTIKNTGTVRGDFYLEPVFVTADTQLIAEELDLVITDSATNAEVYNGKLSALPQEWLGLWAAGETHTYDFHLSFPDKGTTAGLNGAGVVGNDNTYMGASTTVAFNWTAVSNTTGSRAPLAP
jgi:hypothetical protein